MPSAFKEVSFETTLMVRDTCLCLAVQQAARTVARVFDEALQPLDLTNGQFSLLMSLNRPNPPPMGPVADLLAMDRTTLTAALKPLRRRRLVEVIIDPKDRRGRLLALTPAGHKLLARALPVWKRHHKKLERRLQAPPTLRADLAALAR